MKHEIVHMIGHENGAELPSEAKAMLTRCGRTIKHPVVEGVPSRYTLVAENGNQFLCTTRERFVSCIKCINLLTVGSIHGKSRTSNSQKRAVASPNARSR